MTIADTQGAQTYSLISGEFFPEEARGLLMTLIDDKIRFHQRNNWSRRERFGEGASPAEKRIGELRQTKTELAALLETVAADSGDRKVAILCNIQITLMPE